MTTLDHLRAARARIDSPDKWSPQNVANPSGECVVQALIRSVDNHAVSPAQRMCARLLGFSCPTVSLFEWNDAVGRTHADVLALLDEAIAIEEAKAQEFAVEPIREVERV